ncbi:bifunctional DNA primase/polymerase [Streptomyces albidoflavus]|uniref:bifunctional DNA primase/polymerase n=1 Tax=Streptomyces TaxID=1883 RepID=UPI00099D83C3|nr:MULTISPECIES: bifunctional DNA primase/polymerase [Streptomyces]MBO1287129.1 bifunctional DNA primase/polymerase [Streptomyces sampsonii]QHC17342.1 DNA primase [Streptomyces sp. GF20]RZE94870.1 DNA primase [Streptomyces albidoflavus]RZE96101.1 DNA primase [Streptomyces albidoflavus]WJK67114.1 bifunctional DNA primase/polymerase [Streptomyces albidoflavus]
MGVRAAGQIPRQRGEQPLDTAVRYAEERHWDVVPGAWLEAVAGTERCSCGEAACPAPGAHPAHAEWQGQATGSATVVRKLWAAQPRASVLLPTGRAFDAIDVPETAGFLALARMERMELALGPVTRSPDRRMQFFVLPGAVDKVPGLVRSLGWLPARLDLTVLGAGDYVAAPPTRFGSAGAVQWASRPTQANRWLPDAENVISPLAYACGRDVGAGV